MIQKDTALYLSRQIRKFEHRAIHEQNISEDELMRRAGEAAYITLRKTYPHVRTIAIFCGGGNNAGDGYVLARLAQENGLNTIVYHHHPIKDLPPVACQAAERAIDVGVVLHHFDEALDSEVELIVDALLGIGLQGAVRDPIKSAVALINDADLPVLAIDIPSGLNADTGKKLSICVQADVTVTFIAPKVGMYTLDGPDYCGEIICHDLNLDFQDNEIIADANLLNQQQLAPYFSSRRKNVHKGDFGHALIVGGGRGMPGAPCMTAMAALRVGCGMVTIATRPEFANQPVSSLPEAMVYGVDDVSLLVSLLQKATVCIIGPGLGEDDWAQSLFSAVIGSQLPLIIDASALHLLAANQQHDDNWILTPHPGEAAKLLGKTAAEIQEDRLQSACAIHQQYGGTVVLKGVGSVVCTGGHEHYICSAGNPGMATAGMGDVLSGVIAGLVAQGLTLGQAAKSGVWLHAKAGDDAAKHGERGILATDLMPFLKKRVNSIN